MVSLLELAKVQSGTRGGLGSFMAEEEAETEQGRGGRWCCDDQITEEGVTFQSPTDNSEMLLTPEMSIHHQVGKHPCVYRSVLSDVGSVGRSVYRVLSWALCMCVWPCVAGWLALCVGGWAAGRTASGPTS